MGDVYLWLKVLHILAVISWMAGAFYLPRLFVYHAENSSLGEVGRVFKVMEVRLLRVIMRPAGLVAVASGIGLIWLGNWFGPVPVWLWVKLCGVGGLAGFHGVLEWHAKRFGRGVETGTGRYFRFLNEVPTLLLVLVVVMVVVKPF
jgi:putative membrane protein